MYKRRSLVTNEEIIYGYSLLVAENIGGQTGRYKCTTATYNKNREAVQWMNRAGDVGKPCKGGMSWTRCGGTCRTMTAGDWVMVGK